MFGSLGFWLRLEREAMGHNPEIKGSSMLITRLSTLTGKENALEVLVTDAQLDSWASGVLLQDAMPNVPGPLREFIKTGITPEEWQEHFGIADDEADVDAPEGTP